MFSALSVVFYKNKGCLLFLMEEKNEVVKDRMLMRIFVSKVDELTGIWRNTAELVAL